HVERRYSRDGGQDRNHEEAGSVRNPRWGPRASISDRAVQPGCRVPGRTRAEAGKVFVSQWDEGDGRDSIVQGIAAPALKPVRGNHSTERTGFSSDGRKLRPCDGAGKSGAGARTTGDGHNSHLQPIRF